MSIHKPAAAQPNYYKSSFVFLFLSVINAALNYAYYPAIAQFLSPSEFGAVQALIAILLQIGAIFAGLNLVTIYLVNKLDTERAKKTIEILQKLTTGMFLVATLAVIIFQAAVLHFLNIESRLYILLLALDLVTTIPFIIAFGYLQARRQFVTAGMLQLSVVIVKLLAGVVLAKNWGPSGALAGIALGHVLGMLVFWAIGNFYQVRLWDHKVVGSLGLPSISELKFIQPLARGILSLFLVNVSLVVYTSFAIIAGRHYFSPHESGVFTAAVTLASAIVYLSLPLIGVLLPHLDKRRLVASRAHLFKTGAMTLLIIGSSIIFLRLFSEQLLELFGNEYISANYLMPGLAIMMSLVALLNLVLQASAFYKPSATAILSALGFMILAGSAVNNHETLSSFVSTMATVFATILAVATLQIIWIYSRDKTRGV